MNTSHPSENEIQDYAISKLPALTDHIESCTHCKTAVENYQLLFSEIKNQPDPAFDFDLSALILSKLPATNRGLSVENIIAGFLVIFACCCISIPIFLFRHNILNMFSSIPSPFTYAILGSTSIILSIQIGFMFKKYQNQMHFLNFN